VYVCSTTYMFFSSKSCTINTIHKAHVLICQTSDTTWGIRIRMLMRGMVTLPQGNQELLVVKDKVGRPPGELGVSKPIECYIIPFSALI